MRGKRWGPLGCSQDLEMIVCIPEINPTCACLDRFRVAKLKEVIQQGDVIAYSGN